MKPTVADFFYNYLNQLDFEDPLPEGVELLNPMKGNEGIREITRLFYKKFYNDSRQRTLILGINPGRLGGGATGIPFTDTKRLKEKCGIDIAEFKTHEPSSVFVYDWIDAMGGAESFYKQYLIHSVCPLGFVKGKVNYNYYDDKRLEAAALPLIKSHLSFLTGKNFNREVVFCLGTGKNFKFLENLNNKEGYFKYIVPLEHPRFIMQYRSRFKKDYILDFVEKLNGYAKL